MAEGVCIGGGGRWRKKLYWFISGSLSTILQFCDTLLLCCLNSDGGCTCLNFYLLFSHQQNKNEERNQTTKSHL